MTRVGERSGVAQWRVVRELEGPSWVGARVAVVGAGRSYDASTRHRAARQPLCPRGRSASHPEGVLPHPPLIAGTRVLCFWLQMPPDGFQKSGLKKDEPKPSEHRSGEAELMGTGSCKPSEAG